MIEAVARSHVDRPVVLVAPRPEPSETHRLEALAARAGVRLDVRIGVDDVALRDLYRDALATVYVARREPLGLVALEAQAAGSPVIVADEGGLPETVADGRSGFVVPRDADAVV